jgi:hypothetical protein
MRPRKFSYTLTAADDNGYLNDATGAGPWATVLAQPSDDCAHPVTITSSADLSTKTFALVGTDAEGRVLTETVTGANAGTATSTKYFKTLVSVTASATIGASTMDVGWTALAQTPCIPHARFPHGAHSIGVNLSGTTVNYTVQVSNDNVFDNAPAQWHTLGTGNADHDQMLEATDGSTGSRVDVASHTSGVLYVTHSQASS